MQWQNILRQLLISWPMKKNDQEDKAVFYKEKMEDCKERMGTLAFAAEDIDQILKQKNRGEKND